MAVRLRSAIRHPLGANVARLESTAVSQLPQTGRRHALCAMCIGVGREPRWHITAFGALLLLHPVSLNEPSRS